MKNISVLRRAFKAKALRRHTHTHTHTRRKQLCIVAIAMSIVLLSALPAKRADATIIPATSFSEVSAYTGLLGDPVINCDMLQDPNLSVVKAIVWGEGSGGGSGNAGLFAEDWLGNTSSLLLPNGAEQPDVAASITLPSGTSTILYKVVVTYVIGNNLYFRIYDLNNVGTSSFAINSTPAYSSGAISTKCNGYPHIDMWSENNVNLMNVTAMREFAIVWSENVSSGNSQTLMCYAASVTSPLSSSVPLGGVGDCRTPDVACFTDISIWSATFGDKFIEVTYGVASSPSAQTSALVVDEFDRDALFARSSGYPSTLFSGTPLTGSQHGVVYMPRIEAVSYGIGDPTGQVKYVVAADIQAGTTAPYGPYEVWAYSNLYPGGYSISGTQFLMPTYLCMSACVCVGPYASNNTVMSEIGNYQYTVGMSANSSVYARDITSATGGSGTVGALGSFTTWYQVNSNSISGTGGQINKNFAISNCSNSGADILSAWYDGTDVVYKYSHPNTMSFRMGKANEPQQPRAEPAVFPVPATSELHVSGIEDNAEYAVVDVGGRVLLHGILSAVNTVNIISIPSGNYYLRLVGGRFHAYTLQFNKL